MHTCMCTHRHTCTCAHSYTCTHTHMHERVHTCTHLPTLPYPHTDMHNHSHTRVRTHPSTCSHMHTHMHACMPPHMHTHSHARTHPRTRACAHTLPALRARLPQAPRPRRPGGVAESRPCPVARRFKLLSQEEGEYFNVPVPPEAGECDDDLRQKFEVSGRPSARPRSWRGVRRGPSVCCPQKTPYPPGPRAGIPPREASPSSLGAQTRPPPGARSGPRWRDGGSDGRGGQGGGQVGAEPARPAGGAVWQVAVTVQVTLKSPKDGGRDLGFQRWLRPDFTQTPPLQWGRDNPVSVCTGGASPVRRTRLFRTASAAGRRV